MNGATFWNDQEKAKAVIQELKSLNTVLKPFEALVRQAENLEATIELAEEAETDEFDDEIRSACKQADADFDDVRVPLDAQRTQRSLQRVSDDPRRARAGRRPATGRRCCCGCT